eukprot:SAG11_NODE_11916_length_731_cov_3.704114_1_plen_61_part_01
MYLGILLYVLYLAICTVFSYMYCFSADFRSKTAVGQSSGLLPGEDFISSHRLSHLTRIGRS